MAVKEATDYQCKHRLSHEDGECTKSLVLWFLKGFCSSLVMCGRSYILISAISCTFLTGSSCPQANPRGNLIYRVCGLMLKGPKINPEIVFW